MKTTKKKVALIPLLLALVTSFSLAGCSASQSSGSSSSKEVTTAADASSTKATSGGELVYGLTTEPDNLDPYKAATADTRRILFNLFEGLVKPDSEGALQPAVAESYEISPDALTYSFKLRSGIKFHNGNAVAAEDVKYSLETAVAGKVAGFDNIAAVDAVDTSSVKITLKKADTDFLPYLTVAIIPKDYTEQSTKPIGTGPFAFESYTAQQALVLKKNADYWQKDLPYLDKVTFKLESDTNALLLDLQSGSVDAAAVDNATALQLNTSDFSIYKENSNAIQQLNLNNTVKPFDNAKVRQAISYAVDADEIINVVNFGKGVKVGTPVIPGLKSYYDDSLANAYKKDVEKAKSLLKEAGYADGFSFEITVPSNYKVHVDTAQVIVSQLKAIGVTATIQQVDWATWISQVYTNKEYVATIISVDGATLSPRSFLGRYVSTDSGNFFNYKSTAFDELYAKAQEELDEAKRVDIYKQAQKLLSTDAANVFIQDIANLTAVKKGFEGLTPYPLYVFDASTIHTAE